jgi:hypothetical protein
LLTSHIGKSLTKHLKRTPKPVYGMLITYVKNFSNVVFVFQPPPGRNYPFSISGVLEKAQHLFSRHTKFDSSPTLYVQNLSLFLGQTNPCCYDILSSSAYLS